MEAVAIEGHNALLKGNGDTVKDLPVYTNGRLCVSKWKLSEEELQELVRNGGNLYLTVYHAPHNFPPVGLTTDNPVPPFLRNPLRFEK